MALTMLRKDAGGAADDEEDCTVYAVAGLATRVPAHTTQRRRSTS